MPNHVRSGGRSGQVTPVAAFRSGYFNFYVPLYNCSQSHRSFSPASPRTPSEESRLPAHFDPHASAVSANRLATFHGRRIGIRDTDAAHLSPSRPHAG